MKPSRAPAEIRRIPRATRVAACLLAGGIAGAACGEPMGEGSVVELPDGDYVVTLTNPVIVDPLVTPLWMGYDLAIEFTKTADLLEVTGSTRGLVALGPVLSFLKSAEAATARFSWSGHLDGEHYWEVALTAAECLVAKSVDEDLGFGPGGVWTVEIRNCQLTAG